MYEVFALPLIWKERIAEPDWFDGIFMLTTGKRNPFGKSFARFPQKGCTLQTVLPSGRCFYQTQLLSFLLSLFVEEEIFLTPVTVERTPSSTVVTSCSTTRTGASGQFQLIVSDGRYLVGLS